MAFGRKYDYPPLFAPGRHYCSLEDLRQRCVDGFANPVCRQTLFALLEEFVHAFASAGICCEVWVDGSFLTEKEEPGDLDATVMIDADVALSDEQRKLVDQAAASAYADRLDTFAFIRLDRSDPLYGDDAADPAYGWGHQYGLECSEEWLKGFVVIRL